LDKKLNHETNDKTISTKIQLFPEMKRSNCSRLFITGGFFTDRNKDAAGADPRFIAGGRIIGKKVNNSKEGRCVTVHMTVLTLYCRQQMKTSFLKEFKA
jgi:hypothetical protein